MPTFKSAFAPTRTVVATKIRSPHTIGDAWPRPGMGVCQRIFSPVSTFHVVGAGSSDTPLACGPRNCGQHESEAARMLTQSKSAATEAYAVSMFIESRVMFGFGEDTLSLKSLL